VTEQYIVLNLPTVLYCSEGDGAVDEPDFAGVRAYLVFSGKLQEKKAYRKLLLIKYISKTRTFQVVVTNGFKRNEKFFTFLGSECIANSELEPNSRRFGRVYCSKGFGTVRTARRWYCGKGFGTVGNSRNSRIKGLEAII